MARASSLIGRLASPTGFLLVGLCFVLPFLTASCDTQADGQRVRGALSYTGADLVGGRVDLYYEAEARDERGVQRLEETGFRDVRAHPAPGPFVIDQQRPSRSSAAGPAQAHHRT